MKNFLRILVLFSAFFTAFFILYSCQFGDEELLKSPDIEINGDGITVSFAVDSGSSYANIFRKKITDSATGEQEILNIGMIIPSKDDLKTSYSFTDKFIVTGTKYSYCIRYRHRENYVYTGWSEWKKEEDESDSTPPTTNFTNDDTLKFAVPADSYFEYDSDSKALVFKGTDISALTEFNDFVPAICISYENSGGNSSGSGNIKTKSRVFEIEKAPSGKGKGIAAETRLDLRTLLTNDYFGKDLKIEGVLCQKTDTNDSSYTKVYWSQIASVKTKDAGGNDLATINVPLTETSDDLHDFSGFESSARKTNKIQNENKGKETDFSDFSRL